MLIPDYQTRMNKSGNNNMCVLAHVRDAGYSSALIIARLLDSSLSYAYKVLNRLESKGLLRRHLCSELKLTLWGLTDYGILMSWSEDEEIKPRLAFQPSKLSPIMVTHELQLQRAKIQAELYGFKGWVFGSHLPGKLEKRPDAIVTSPMGERYACELERFSKSRKRLEIIISIFLRAIKRGDYDQIAYIAPNQDLAFRLKKLFRSITHVPVSGQLVPLTESHYEKFLFFSLDRWPHQSINGLKSNGQFNS